MVQAGGPADKYGNQYEAWWTIYRLMDLVRGREHSITLEPPGREGAGVEFFVTGPHGRSFEQVKSGTSKSWSWRRAKDELLAPVMGHLERGDRVRFILAKGSPALARVTDLARSATGADLPSSPELDQLVSEWQKPREEVMSLLSRVTVDHMPRAALHISARDQAASLFTGDPDRLVQGLHGWLFTKVHQAVDAVDVVAEAHRSGSTRRDLVGDEVTALAMARTVDAFNSRLRSSAGGVPTVARDEVGSVLDALRESRVVLLHGLAGSGKSEIVRQVLQRLDPTWKRAVLRMDTLSAMTLTALDLGHAAGLSDSPTAVLGGHADQAASLLVVDQLDAISSFSGRMPDSFESVREIIQSRAAWPRMRLLLVTRTVDLERDPRFRELAEPADVSLVEVTPLSDDQVRTMLGTIPGIDRRLTRVDKRLLRIPIYARLFAAVAADLEEGRELAASDLFDEFESHARRAAPPGSNPALWTQALAELARRMSESESLSLDPRATADLEPLVTELTTAGLLVQEGRKTAFFHERYADHVFARSFLDEGLDLFDFVVGSGQALFRRAQVRQILQLQLDRRPSDFFASCVRLISDGRVRRHLQEVVYETLRSAAPTPQQWMPFQSFVTGAGYRGEQVRSLLLSLPWLEAADAQGHVSPLLDGEYRESLAYFVLANAASAPDTVERLIRPHMDDAWMVDSLRQFLARGHVHASPFVAELVDRGHLDDEGPPRSLRPDAWIDFHRFEPDDPTAIWWLDILLKRAVTLCEKQDLTDPFADGVLVDRQMSGEEISDMAKAQPKAFFAVVAPFVVWTAMKTAEVPAGDDLTHQRSRWDHWFTSDLDSVADLLLDGLSLAAETLGATDEDRSWALDLLGEEPIAVLAYLRGRVHVGSNDPDQALLWLVEDRRNMALSWGGDPHGTATALIAAHADRASQERVRDVEDAARAFVPKHERSVPCGWRHRGHAEWILLLSFPPAALSSAGRRRLDELIRKFGRTAPTPPTIESGFVSSPVPQSAVDHMTDAAWVSAIAHYDGTSRRDSHHFLKGGPRELAIMLGEQSKNEPGRYLDLAKAVWPWCAPVYRQHMLRGLSGEIDVQELTALAAEARRMDGVGVGRSIASAADQYAGPWPADLVELVMEISGDPDPREGDTSWHSDRSSLGHNLSMQALNSDRGAAADALARHIWGASPAENEHVLPAVERLCRDEVPAVRAAACTAVGALTRTHRSQGLQLALDLFSRGLEPLATHQGFTLFRFLLLNRSDARATLLLPALESTEPEVAKHAGAVWAALDYHGLLDGLPSEWAEIPVTARTGVAWAWTAGEPELDEVIRVMSDGDADVRAEAMHAVRHFTGLETTDLERLLQHTITSPYFSEFSDAVVRLLEDYERGLPPSSITFAEQLLDSSDRNDMTSGRGSRGLVLSDLLQVLLRLNRQSPKLYGERVLGCIDVLVQTESARVLRLLDLDEAT